MDERIKRLRDLAAEAKGQYRVELEAGGEPTYPTWIDERRSSLQDCGEGFRAAISESVALRLRASSVQI